ncbi:MAG: hypothetical protein QOE70_5507 [Chthoniobacter sp.]|jgi:ParB-like chromosome segregation protein Spo0J|nr:hypothetical protein [Chthoniobacter sp.]
MTVPLSSIQRDTALQMRAKPLDLGIITEYAEAMERGDVFPPIIVFADDPNIEQTRLWLGDGWHRIEACVTLGLKTIEAEIRPGGRRAAFLFSLGANDHHGMRRTRADKHHAVEAALADMETRQLSDREIARLCGVDNKTVAKAREEHPDLALLDTKRRGRDGKVQSAHKRVRISSPAPAPLPKDEELSPLRQWAQSPEGRAASQINTEAMARIGAMKKSVRDLFDATPEEKRHLFCVEIYKFICDHDPEVDEMNRTARQVGNPTVHNLLTTPAPQTE